MFLERWNVRYGSYTSIGLDPSTRCQICHVSDLGGSAGGWNGYGWRVFELLESRKPFSLDDLDYAFDYAGLDNSDADTTSSSNLTEIQTGYFPGWSEGSVNTHYFGNPFENPQQSNNQPPPAGIQTDLLDPPKKLENPVDEVLTTEAKSNVLRPLADGFNWPKRIIFKPGDDQFVFVSELNGKVWAINQASGQRHLFFDINENMNDELIVALDHSNSLVERGLLNMVFHPDYLVNKIFYTFHSEVNGVSVDFSTMPVGVIESHQSVITQWQVTSEQQGTVTSVVLKTLLRIAQPQPNNNGGGLLIDAQGNLLIGMGDGGGKADRDLSIEFNGQSIPVYQGHLDGNASDSNNPLGAVLRIEPLGASSINGAYGFPADNPFLEEPDKLSEVYAIGFRNPDDIHLSQDGRILVVDQGEVEVSEINLLEAQENYGWSTLEGDFSYIANGQDDSYLSEAASSVGNGRLPEFSVDHDLGHQLIIGGSIDQAPALSGFLFATRTSFDGSKGGAIYLTQNFSQDTPVIVQKIIDSGTLKQSLHTLHDVAVSPAGRVYVTGNANLEINDNSGVLFELRLDESDICFPLANKTMSRYSLICL